MSSEPDARQILSSVAARNGVARDLGIELVEGRLGYARLALTVQDRMVGGHGICQGGYIFTLADMTGAYACLSHNRQTVTQTAHITYVSPAQRGERLVAEAVELTRTRRSATYDVRVTAGDGRLVALFRGQWRIMEAPAIDPSGAPTAVVRS
ncbi:MAG TPA: hotdog fold thioesterase [Stellaceae bacterium]|nr:hotdog fold thioesterase [Stellaceae bacterium]